MTLKCKHCGNRDVEIVDGSYGAKHATEMYKCNQCRKTFTITLKR